MMAITTTGSFLLRLLLLVGFVCLLLFASLGCGEARKLKHGDHQIIGRESDFNYMSKRRVPKGPDPIHNRRAGNSGQSPGQV
ncbi:CLAVATA3/ESR (CLE)-related protein 25 [Senna tora]|uniref:CLAVATA3/ESR (CLE)-related protein 25 n=1 Tax=Senna tora TaxID=362788 RepID=A0A834WRI9_9FABA|nr:CLAVATA3/ESR (CLE)-related protein 25 [Senna tora]